MEPINNLEQIREMLAQEYTILHHSVLTDIYIKDRFILAVGQENNKAVFEKLIDLLLGFNEEIRKNGFLHYAVLKDKLNNKVFHAMADLLCHSTNLLKIKALLTPRFWYLSGNELVENVLIHDAVQMTVLGYTNEEMKLELYGMIGKWSGVEKLKMKAHTYICFVDTENFSAKHFMKVRRKLWELEETHENAGIYCFGLKKDKEKRLKEWVAVTESINKVDWKWLDGSPEKNKVDNEIIKSVELLLATGKCDKIDTYCFMTSDGDYADIIHKLCEKDKFTIVFGKKNASERLKSSCNMYKPWDE